MTPRSIYFVNLRDSEVSEPNGIYWAETDPEQAKEAKPQYRDINLSGQIEGRFLFKTALSKHVLPFVLRDLPTVVLPILDEDRRLRQLSSVELRALGFREIGKWMSSAERIWDDRRGEKADRQTLGERLDYQKELTNQRLSDRFLPSPSSALACFSDTLALALPVFAKGRCPEGALFESTRLTTPPLEVRSHRNRIPLA